MNAKTLSRSAVAVAVAVALSAGYVAGHRDRARAPGDCAGSGRALMPAEAAAKTGIPDFSGLVETYGPAVVNISAKHVVKQTAMRSGGANGGNGGNAQQLPIDPSDPFYQFYKHFFGGMPGMQGGDGGGDQAATSRARASVQALSSAATATS
jgi:serine protease Do